MRLGSLCSGVGLLDLAVESLFGAETVWQAENDKDASKVLARHWPGVPNLGDLKAVDWSSVEPIDVLCAGYPCQPFSSAGRRNGTDDPRHIWPDVARAIGALRPRLVLLENVSAHLSLGFTAVLGDLAAMGLDAEWGLVRASEVGAPHRRERLFIVAWPAADAGRSPRWEVSRGAHGYEAEDEGGSEDTGDLFGGSGEAAAPDADESGFSWFTELDSSTRPGQVGESGGQGIAAACWQHPDRPVRSAGVALLPTPRTSDANGSGEHGNGGPDLRTVAALLPTPTARDHKGSRAGDTADAGRRSRGDGGTSDLPGALLTAEKFDRWGDFAAAIFRWEAVLGREAPAPLVGKRLSARFVEWMMGAPGGWVTDTPGVSHSAALKCLGNGVVSLQAELAYRLLLDRIEVAA